MPRTGIADLTLHSGKVPPWLFQRMARLSRAITLAIVEERGCNELLHLLSHPYWFQALGCLLGFDWHSSGLTTTVCGAIKEGLRGLEREIGIFVAGGKGSASRKTPAEISKISEMLGKDLSKLVYASRISAKVDSAALQDGYELYHHTFLFTADGKWAVIQQGMNKEMHLARRYHWLGEKVKDFVCEPHSGIASQRQEKIVLNLVAREGERHRDALTFLSREERPENLVYNLERLQHLSLPHRHALTFKDINPRRLYKVLLTTYEMKPSFFEELLAFERVGAKTLRALSLLAEVVYGVPASFRDPAIYSFAHGGKDRHPYPVDRQTYDETIAFLEDALKRARLGERDKLDALRRLSLL